MQCKMFLFLLLIAWFSCCRPVVKALEGSVTFAQSSIFFVVIFVHRIWKHFSLRKTTHSRVMYFKLIGEFRLAMYYTVYLSVYFVLLIVPILVPWGAVWAAKNWLDIPRRIETWICTSSRWFGRGGSTLGQVARAPQIHLLPFPPDSKASWNNVGLYGVRIFSYSENR